MKTPLALLIYRALGHIAAPALALFLKRRIARGKEDPARQNERWGRPTLPRPDGVLIWLHAASVGETMSILPLITRLAGAGRHVLLTTGTVTSAALAAARLPEGAVHQFVPLDLPAAARRFIAHWRPDLAVFCESELWPTLMLETKRADIPLGIVNGRMSARSATRWRKFPTIPRALLGDLAFCLAQSEADAARYAALGAPAVAAGNLKFDAPPLPLDLDEAERLTKAIGRRPVFLAASTHPGEEEQVLDAACHLREREPDLLTIIVPRHPPRGEEIAKLCLSGGIVPAVRSRGEMPDKHTTLYLADTLGELGLFYALATVAFIGGSLVPTGGHNPIEPAKLGAPMLHGPETHNFKDIFAAFDAAGAAVAVVDSAMLAHEAGCLIGDDAARSVLVANARAIAAANEGALERTLGVIEALLPGPAP
ncbi:MAG: 3-deoxy-D-manno-octulosonic-acid [Beijerinckiaceae bacterium]|nr:MAG: 3-deoxy-D-manno-octulosonic-acid [Beijerinckiaceae bacterium]